MATKVNGEINVCPDSNQTSLSEKPVCRSVRRGFGSDQCRDSPADSKQHLSAAETVPSRSCDQPAIIAVKTDLPEDITKFTHHP